MADILIQWLQGEWRDLGPLDIWGFDSGGKGSYCEKNRALGNGSDQALHLLSQLRKRLDKAGVTVSLVGCVYEATVTLAVPLRGTPENLLARDCVFCYPFHRCYAHDPDDPACAFNAPHYRMPKDWISQKPRLSLAVGECCNVHHYEDLPRYARLGAEYPIYIHPPLEQRDFRAVSHMLLAE